MCLHWFALLYCSVSFLILNVKPGLPMDVVKVRVQAGTVTNAKSPNNAVLPLRTTFRGPLDCVLQTFRKEGVRAFYKGATAAVTAAVLENSGLLFTFTVCALLCTKWYFRLMVFGLELS
jgi:hypothetical protein